MKKFLLKKQLVEHENTISTPYVKQTFKNLLGFFILFFLFLNASSGWGQTTVTIGSGTNVGTNYPISPYFGYSYSQQIVLQSEIANAGSITKIRFYSNGTALTSNCNNWTIYLGHTTKTVFTSNTDWIQSSSLTQVFSGTVNASPSAGWMEVTLSTPFNYNNTDNLIVGVDENASSYTGGSSTSYFRIWTTPVTNRGIHYKNDTTNPDPSSISLTGTRTSYIAQMQFDITPPVTPYVSATAVTAFGNTCINTTAGPNSTTITAGNLTGNITLGALTGFSYSTTAGGTYNSTLDLTPSSGNINQVVYVKFDPTLVQSYSGNIPITGGGLAATVNVAVTGAGVNSAPTVSVNGTSGSITTSGATVSGSTISALGCSTVTAYGIEYSTTSGFANGTGIQVAGSGFSGSAGGTFNTTLTGLSATTTYYYKAYATNAGGTTYFSSQSSFTTPCASVSSFPYSEGFNTSSRPSCWTEQLVSGSLSFGYPTSGTSPTVSPQAGTNMVYYNSYSNSTQTRLVSLPLNTNSLTSVDLEFYWYHGTEGGATFYTTEGVTPQWSINGSTWTSIGSQILRYNATAGWTKYTLTLPAGAINQTSLYIGFLFQGNGGYNSYLDSVTIKQTPTCFAPTLAATTGINSTGATINWSASSPAPANGYEYYYSTSNTTPTAGTAPSGTVGAGILTATLTSLNIETPYYFWVRSACSVSDKSEWSSIGTFTTLPITTVQSGSWNDGAVWSSGVVPTCTTNVAIQSGHTVTVNSAGNQVKNTTINSGGTLVIASGDLTVGCTNNNTPFTNNGTLTVSGGTLAINGNMVHNLGATFNQSSGEVVIDGNAAGNTANSVLTGTNLLRINTNLLSLTGGKITIVDPHAGTSSTDYAIGYSTSGLHYACGTGHTVQFGNGTSTEAGGHSNGFYNYLYVGTGYLTLGNVIVDANTGTNRHVNNTSTVGILGNLTITSGEFRTGSSTVYVAGNVANSGILTTDGTLGFATWTNGTVSAISTAQTVSGSGIYRNLTSAPSANFNSINTYNTSATGVTFNALNNLSGAAGFSGASVFNTITFNGKASTASGNALLWGTATARGTGSLTVTSGGMTNGSTFAIGTSTSQTGTSISSGADPSSTNGRYPFVNTLGQNRSVYMGRVTASGAGITAFTYNESTGTTNVSITDGAYTVNTRSNDNFVFSTFGTTPTAATFNLAFTTPAIFGGNPSTAVARIVQASGVIGTYQAGTTTPTAQRTGLTLTDLASGAFYMGINAVDVPFVSIASGDWNNAATWNKGTVPTCTDNATIDATHNVTVNSAGNVSKNLTINAGGTLTIASADLTVGCTNNNTPLTNNGTLTVTGGTLTINGNYLQNTGATLNQSGGDIVVDGNAAGVTANSVASGTHIFNVNASAAANLNLTGGMITLVDPHANTSTTDYVLRVSQAGSVNQASTGHTFKFGNGVSTDAGGNASYGFSFNTPIGTYPYGLGNVIVDAGTGTNRYVSTPYTNATILGNLNITSGEYRQFSNLYLNGNLVNNGTFTATSTLTLANYTNNTNAPSSNAQTISGSGTFRNSTSTSTASLYALTVNNNNATGVTLNVPLSISSTLTMTSGIINTTSTNLLTLGTTTAAATLSGTPSATNMVKGPFARTFSASTSSTTTLTNTHLFPVGNGSTSLSLWYSPTVSSTGATTIKAEVFAGNTGTAGSGVNTVSNYYWEALATAGSSNITNAVVQVSDFASMTATTKLLTSATASGVYDGTPGGSVYTAGTPNLVKQAIAIPVASLTNYFAYGDMTICTAPTDAAQAFTASVITTTSFTGTITPASSNPTGYLLVRYASGATPSATPVDGVLYSAAATLGNGTVVGNYYSSTLTLSQTGLTANTTYDYKLYSFNNTGCAGPTYNTSTILSQSVTTCATTVGASGTPTVSSVTTTSATISWTASSTSGVSYLLDVATNSSFTTFLSGYQSKAIGVGVLTENLSGLSVASTYYVRVYAINGSCTSSASSTLTFSTECNVETAPTLVQTFLTAPPSCWKEASGTLSTSSTLTYGSSSWGLASGFANTGTNSGYKINLYDSQTDSQWIVSQSIDLGSTAGLYRLKYNTALTSYSGTLAQSTMGGHSVKVVVSTDGGATWSTSNIIKTYAGTGTYSNTGQTEIIDLSAYSGVIKIGFFAESDYSSFYDIDFHIDDFIVEAIPAPAITAVTSSVTCGSSTLVTISGTNLGNATSVKIGGITISPLTTNTATQITATVSNAFSGTVEVTTVGGTGTSSGAVTFTNAPALTLSAYTQSNCVGATNPTVTTVTSTIGDFNSYVWTPSTGVSGDENTGWTFNPATTTTYTLNVSSAGGCTNSKTMVVTVNPIPSAISISPTAPSICNGATQTLTATGGTLSGLTVLSENFNSGVGTFVVTANSSTTAQDWTPRSNGYVYSSYTFSGSTNGFMMANSDVGGSSATTNTILTSPSFSTIGYSGLTLALKEYLKNSTDTYAAIEISSDNFVSDINVLRNNITTDIGSASSFNPTSISIPSTYENKPNVKIRFRYQGSYDWFWAVDEIVLTGTQATTFAWSPATGLNTTTGATVNASPSTTTTYTVTATSSSGCINTQTVTVTIKERPTAVVSGSATLACGGTQNLSVALTGTAPWALTYTDGTTPVSVTGITTSPYVVSVSPSTTKTYTVTALSDSNCSAISADMTGSPIIQVPTATWDGAAWVGSGGWPNGTPPTSNVKAVINGVYANTVSNQITACTLEVTSNGVLTAGSGSTITLENQVVASANTATFESGSSLIQNTNVTNTGNIIYKRTAPVLNLYDYEYWSTPVKNQVLGNIWMTTNPSHNYKFDNSTQSWVALTAPFIMVDGEGYISRAVNSAPLSWSVGNEWTANFSGIPNNGDITYAVTNGDNLIGNPYPSALDLNSFTTDNSTYLTGNYYFWTHTSELSNNTYSSDDYAVYNISAGGTAATNGGAAPDQYVDSGQAFFAEGQGGGGTITFKNAHRVAGNNDNFYRTTALVTDSSTIEKHRIWLNLTTNEGVFKQQLLAYIPGATYGYDPTLEAKSYDANSFVDFYSFAGNHNLTIQSRVLPFDNQDLVPLGYKSTMAGNFTIAIDHIDGLFENQNIYLEDQLLNVIHDLKASPYTFASAIGTFNARFVLRYTNSTLNYPTFDSSQVVVYKHQQEVIVNSGKTEMQTVSLFDIRGRLINEKTTINANETRLNLGTTNQVVLVQVILKNGQKVTKKIVN